MSIILTKAYKNAFKEIASNMGFKQKGSMFIRIVNDEIIQTVYLFKGSTPVEFTLNVGIFPFCIENNKLLFKEGNFRLEDFIDNRYEWWEYSPLNYNSAVLAVNDALNYFKENVCLVLNQVIDCKSFLDLLIKFDIKEEGEIIWNCDHKLYCYLKMGEYKNAIRVINAIEEQNLDAALARKNLFPEEEYEADLMDIKQSLESLNQIRDAAKNNNKEFIDGIIDENEDVTKKILKQYGFKF